MPKYNSAKVFENAQNAAQAEVNRALPNTHWYPCGFAGVRIRPARGAFVNWLKENDIGRTDSYAGGYYIPSWAFGEGPGAMVQSMTLSEIAADAAVEVISRETGLNVSRESRID